MQMSEQAQAVTLQEKTKKAKQMESSGKTYSILGFTLFVFGIVLSTFYSKTPPWTTWIILPGAIFIMAFGLIEICLGATQYRKLSKQMKTLPLVTQTCSKCGKQIPQGDFEFCPFCGNSLKTS
jgi:Flp pilus assembly protein TadB